MSHAFVATPMVVQAVGPSALAAVATSVLLPVLIGATMMTIVAAVAKASEKERTCCATYVRHDLNQGIDRLEERYREISLTDKARTALAAEMAEIRSLPDSIAEAVTRGTVALSDVQRLKDRIESVDMSISKVLARQEENRHSTQYLAGKILNLWTQIDAEAPSTTPKIEALRAEWRLVQALGSEDLDEKIERSRSLAVQLGKILDRDVMQRLAAKMTGEFPTQATVPTNDPGSPDEAARRAMERDDDPAMLLRRYRSTIEEVGDRLGEVAPELLTERLETLRREAADSDFPQRVKAIADEFRMIFQKVQEQRFLDSYFRGKLQAAATCLAPSHALGREVEETLRLPMVSRKVFDELWRRLETELTRRMEQEKRDIIETRLRESLEKLDYVVRGPGLEESLSARLEKGEICRLETKYPDYHLLMRFAPEGGLVIRLIKVVGSEREKAEVGEFQRQKDQELMKEWCKNLDAFREHLMTVGIVLIEDIRLEDKIDYLTIEQLEQQKIDTSGLRDRRGKGEGAVTPGVRERKSRS